MFLEPKSLPLDCRRDEKQGDVHCGPAPPGLRNQGDDYGRSVESYCSGLPHQGQAGRGNWCAWEVK